MPILISSKNVSKCYN